MSEPGPTDSPTHPELAAASLLLEEAAMVRQTADDAIDLPALARQCELLTRAHDRLASALAQTDRG